MKFLSKKSTALILSAIMVIASTLISVNVKLGSEVRKVTDSFYKVGDTITDTGSYRSISSHLNNFCAYTDGLVTIADNYGIDTEDAYWASRWVKQAMTYSEDEIMYIYSEYSDLVIQTDKLIDQLYRADLNERDASGLAQYESSIEGAKSAIEAAASVYNSTVREFLAKNDHFPTDFLAELADVEMPEYFGYGW